MKKGNLIFSLVLEGFGFLIIADSYQLGFQTFSNPGPGLFPFLLGVLLCMLTFPLCITSFKGLLKTHLVDKGQVITRQPHVKQLAMVVAFLIGYFLLLDVLGFLIDTFLFLFGLFWIGYPGRLLRVALLSAAVDALAYLIFYVLLQVQFPSGFFSIG
jgi:putative tricarboxylic transport membrane protein